MEEEGERSFFRQYVADSMHYMGEQKYIPKAYSKMIAEAKKPQDNRSGEEIAQEVIELLGLEVL